MLIKHEREVQLEHEVEQLKYQVDKLNEEVKMLERMYGYESYLNNELIDLLRVNHINFRPALAKANRKDRGDTTTSPLVSIVHCPKSQ